MKDLHNVQFNTSKYIAFVILKIIPFKISQKLRLDNKKAFKKQ